MIKTLAIKYRFILVALLALGTITLFIPQKASAAYTDLPDTLPTTTEGYSPYIHLTTNSNDDSGSGAYSQTTSVKVYSQAKVDRVVHFYFPAGDSCYPNSNFNGKP